jgi:hypothetical protein
MDRQTPVTVPASLRHRDGVHNEAIPACSRFHALVRTRRILTGSLWEMHRLWLAVWMATGVAALKATSRKSGKPPTTFARTYREVGHLFSIGGEHALWLKNVRANLEVTLRFRRATLNGARNPPQRRPTLSSR